MEHKLIMENWRKYKKNLDEGLGALTGMNMATSAYDVAVDDEITQEFFEFLVEMVVIFLAEPSKVMNNPRIWPFLKKYTKLNFINYKKWTLEAGKGLNAAQRRAMKELSARPIARKLASLASNEAARSAVVVRLMASVGPVLGVALPLAAVAWALYEIMKISFDVASKTMKAFGLRDTYDELGDHDWFNLTKDWWNRVNRGVFEDDPTLAKDSPGHEESVRYTTENFDKWDQETQVGWCVRNSDLKAPKDFKGELTCRLVLDKANPELIQKAKIAQSSGKSDGKLAMSVPAL
jgi:hypothetical protein